MSAPAAAAAASASVASGTAGGGIAPARPPPPSSSNMFAIVRDLGPAFTWSRTNVRSVIELEKPPDSDPFAQPRIVAAALSAMAVGPAPVPTASSEVAAVLKASGIDVFSSAPNTSSSAWDVDVFVAGVMDCFPLLDWLIVARCLDSRDFVVYDVQGLSIVLNCFKQALKDIFKFPVTAFLGSWQNPKGQVSFLKHAIFSAPELFSFPFLAGLPSARRVLSDSLVLGKNLPQSYLNQPWNNLDLLDTLISAAESDFVFDEVKAIFDVAVQSAPELVLLGLAQIPPPWTPLHKDVASTLVIMFLSGNNNSSFVIPLLWQVSPTLVLAGLVHVYTKDPSQLGRVLDIVQEIKALSPILESSKHIYFNLDLAALAFRRGFVNLEKWLMEKIQLERGAGSTSFLKGCLDFVGEKVSSFAAGNGINLLPVEIVAIFLRVLRNRYWTFLTVYHSHLPFFSPMTPELAIYFKEILTNCVKVYPQLVGGGGGGASALDDGLVKTTTNPIDLANTASLVTGAPAGSASEAEREVNLYYGRLLKGEATIPQIVDLLRRYRDSSNPREQEVFSLFSQVHLDEYKFFPEYPDRQLLLTSTLFGALIQDVYMDAKNLANSLRCVLDALRQPSGSKFFQFGNIALMQFQQRLHEWPHYCSLLLQIPHLAQSNPEIVAYVTPLATMQQEGAVKNTDGAGGVVEAGSEPAPGKSAPETNEKPVFASLKLDPAFTSLPAIVEPDESVRDKILFIINNITFDNLDGKVEEMREALEGGSHFRWFSQYLVVKRASIEPNFHELYIALLDHLKFASLMNYILHETYANINILLNSDKTVTSSSERTLLKSLGSWLGAITLAKNIPIKHKNLAVKNLLLEGFESDRLIVVIPFVCKVLEQCQNNKVFTTSNPWLMAIMKFLSELYHFADLKLNLKFEIEVLCKKIQLDIKDIEPAMLLRNRPSKIVQKKLGAPESMALVNPAAVQPAEESLYPIAMYITLPNLPIFSQQPSMKRIVHIAIDRAIREVIVSPVVERSVTIAGIATRELIVKDFASEPNEEKMRRAAHLMTQSLAGSLAIVSSRDPLRIAMMTQLQLLLRQNGITEQAISEQLVLMIVNDNLDLACTVMERAAAEKSVAEIDESLASAYMSRRKHRERSTQPYYDISIFAASSYPSSLPEPLRLKRNGLTPNQFRVYEDFAKMAKPQPLPAEGKDSKVFSVASEEHSIPLIVAQAVEKLDLVFVELDKCISSASSFTAVAQLPAQHEVKVLLRQIFQFLASFNRDDIFLVTGQKIVGQLFKIENSLSRESYALLLERIFDLSKRTAKEIVSWFLFSSDERRLNAAVVLIMIRVHLLPIVDLDIHLARAILNGEPKAVEFAGQLLKAVLLNDPPYAAYDDFFNLLESLDGVAAKGEGDEETLEILREIKNRYSIQSLKLANMKDLEPNELRESFVVLFTEWVKIFNHPASSEKSLRDFVVRLQQLGVLQEEDMSSLFFRVCTELSVDLFTQAKSNPTNSLQPFQAVDAFSRLIVLLVRHHVEPAGVSENVAKLELTTKILYIIVLVSVHAHEQRRGQFNQRPFFRLFSSLLNDLNAFEDELQDIYYQILFKISNTLHTLQPSFLPGFTLSWLQLISHRFFMPKLLAAESQKGWPFFQRLLVDLFKFLGPFLRQSEMADAIRLLYKATLRILLVLLHDFPEFLCDYHFSFVEVIPHSCIQLRNLILSAFPRNMRLPDPFTPNLKVDLLPESNQPPHVMSDFTSTLTLIGLKADIDSFIKTRAPASFLTDLRSRLMMNTPPQPDDYTKYNLSGINSLVLYVGVQAIALAQAKGTSAAATLSQSAPMDIFQQLITDFDSEGRYLLLSAIANQLRFPNSHTHYFSTVLLYLFAEASEEIIQEQITSS
ncbi:hypothetical protein HDU83_000454 [Entophlyctis luteolus]|nr:hypothetical protein HDU83_000454 [Entophlyctis luteolus]